ALLLLASLVLLPATDLLPSLSDSEDLLGWADDVVFVGTSFGGVFAAASIFAVQMTVHGGCLQVLGSASQLAGSSEEVSASGRGPSSEDAEASVRAAFGVAVPAALLLATVGYLRFGSGVAGNILFSLRRAADHGEWSAATSFGRQLMQLALT
ncbi:unnamed protein product, partial [Polarella glacialis]